MAATSNERNSQQRIIVGLLDSVPTGEFKLIPAHVTLLGWHAIKQSGYYPAFSNALSNISRDLTPFSITGVKRDIFGPIDNPEKQVNVTKVRSSGALHNHQVLFNVASRFVDLRSPHYFDQKYTPHVSDVNEESFGIGDVADIQRLHVIRNVAMSDQEDVYEVERVISLLKGQNYAPTARH